MPLLITQNDLDLLTQASQQIYLKAELLNRKLEVLDCLEGVIINDQFNCTGDSVQRRSYSCDIVITDSTFLIGKDKKIWLDKRLRIYYGIRSLRTQEITWYRIGTFLYSDMSYKVSRTERTLSLSCVDLMAEYDGTLNGQIGGYGSANTDSSHIVTGLTIPAGQDIRASVIATLKEAHIDSYAIADIKKEVPYDLELQTGATYCDAWTMISELYDSWEFFFDADGIFIWREIPNCADDPVALDDTFMQQVVIDESANTSFNGIYNVTEVWGKVLDLEGEDRYADTSTYSNNVYQVNLSNYTSWEDVDNLTQIGIKIRNTNLSAPKCSVNGFPAIPIYDGNGNPLQAGDLKAETAYIFRYRRLTVDANGVSAALFLLGQYQCYGKYVENTEECPFSVQNLGYEILQAVDYNGLSDDAACYNQAEYLTYQSTAMMDTLNLNTLVIPWMEINAKIRYTPKYNGETNQYIVKNFSWSTGTGTMTLTLYKFLESFSFVYNRRKQKNSEVK